MAKKQKLFVNGKVDPIECGHAMAREIATIIEDGMEEEPIEGVPDYTKTMNTKNYTRELSDKLLAKVASGQTVSGAARTMKLSPHTVWHWRRRNYDNFIERLQEAQEACVEKLVDEIIDIADDKSRDLKTDAKGGQKIDWEVVARSKIRIDARKWIASVVNPRKYGEKIAVQNTGTLKIVSEDPQTIELAKSEWTNEHSTDKGH